jgi:hypothetical protein
VQSRHLLCYVIVDSTLLTGSLLIAAVRPTPEEPLPVVYTPRGATDAIYLSSCDLATPGSPIKHILMSPLYEVINYMCNKYSVQESVSIN